MKMVDTIGRKDNDGRTDDGLLPEDAYTIRSSC